MADTRIALRWSLFLGHSCWLPLPCDRAAARELRGSRSTQSGLSQSVRDVGGRLTALHGAFATSPLPGAGVRMIFGVRYLFLFGCSALGLGRVGIVMASVGETATVCGNCA